MRKFVGMLCFFLLLMMLIPTCIPNLLELDLSNAYPILGATGIRCSQNVACTRFKAGLDELKLWKAQGEQDFFAFDSIFWRKKEPGIFVEFGARDGERHSNTYFFEHALHWTGLLVEASALEVEGIKERRPNSLVLHGAICNKRGLVDFKLTDALNGLSSQMEYDSNRCAVTFDLYSVSGTDHYFKAIQKIPCYTLNEVLNVSGLTRIDYMTVDTEGSELSILEALDFDRFAITLMQIETIGSETEKRAKLDRLMSSRGYQLIHTVDLHLDTWDLFYLRTHRADTIKFDRLRLQGWPEWFLQVTPDNAR